MNKQQLANRIWASANKMRSKIEANEYKDYILGFIFYKFLSEQEIKFFLSKKLPIERFREALTEDQTKYVQLAQRNLGYFIPYEYLYSTWIAAGHNFSVANVRDALSAFNRLLIPVPELADAQTKADIEKKRKVFVDIFETLHSGLKNLGGSEGEQTTAIRNLLALIKDIPMDAKQDYDVLGFIYEYLISQFAANAGKKAGEFYTPHEVSVLMSEIIAYHLRGKSNIDIYDPTSGSGSLLINIGRSIAKHLEGESTIKFYAQELKKNTFNLTRMNLVMRGITPDNIVVRNGDTLKSDWPYFEEGDPEGTYQHLLVDAVVSNPPYSQSWEPPRQGKTGIQIKIDPRFEYGIAPKSKADYAFLLHDLYHLKNDGVMAIVLPHGVLFRGASGDGSEGSIREQLIENNHIDTIIGLPADIFFGTGIPTIVIILRKDRQENNVLFIDASHGFTKEGKKNKLRASDIRRIVDTHIQRCDIDRFARVVSKEEIRQNGYNLNIPRYINASEAPESWDMHSILFGGVPRTELLRFAPYFEALPGLETTLFAQNDTPYTLLQVADLEVAISTHPAVQTFIQNYQTAFGEFQSFLKHELIDQMETLSIARVEELITAHIFESLAHVPLVDRYEAYQLFADQWTSIAQGLEIIQSEGFGATRVVDPKMELKKNNAGEEYEVQNGWQGRVLSFDLVQAHHLTAEVQTIERQELRLTEATSELETTFDALDEEERSEVSSEEGDMLITEVERRLGELLTEVETDEVLALEDYLLCSRKKEKLDYIAAHPEVDWQVMDTAKDGTYGMKVVKARIDALRRAHPFEEESTEAQLIRITLLSAEIKQLTADIKNNKAQLIERTKEVIEQELSDDDILALLSAQWIDALYNKLGELPQRVISDLVQQLKDLEAKYDTTLMDVEHDIQEASASLALMIDELTGSAHDLEALAEFKKLLLNA